MIISHKACMLFPIQETLKAKRIFCRKHLTSAGNRITFEDVNQSVLFTAAWNVRNSTYEKGAVPKSR